VRLSGVIERVGSTRRKACRSPTVNERGDRTFVAQFELSRVDGARDRLRKYRVMLDDRKIGRVKSASAISGRTRRLASA
jgi:hypothetical protein